MPRTKKTPMSLKPGSTATSRPDETPKGSGPSVAPSLGERAASPDVVTVAEGDLYPARMRAPHVDATIPVHRASDRVVYRFVSPGVVRLGPTVSEFREAGALVTPLREVSR